MGRSGDAGTRRDRVCVVNARGACARTTDVSKAADAVFVMLMLSLLTAQRGAILLPPSPPCLYARARGGINSYLLAVPLRS